MKVEVKYVFLIIYEFIARFFSIEFVTLKVYLKILN
jgi:hypothetical protein